MSTYQAIAERVIDTLKIGVYGTGTARTATTFTATADLQNSNAHGNESEGWWIESPNAPAGTGGTEADRVKPVKTIAASTGVLTQAGSSWTNTTDQFYFRLLHPAWHPTRVLKPLINRGLEKAWQTWRTILSDIPNADFEASTIGGTDSNATGSRSTTAANVWQGAAAGRVLNSAANGYHQMAAFDAMAGRQFISGGFARIAVGTGHVYVRDGSNSVAVKDLSFSGVGQPHYFSLNGTWPSTCYSGLVRVGGDGASDDVYYDDLFMYSLPLSRINAPSWVTQVKDPETGASLVKLFRQRNRLVGDNSSGPARAYDLERIPDNDWQLVYIPGAAQPLYFEFGKELDVNALPIIIQARRPFVYNDAGTRTGTLSADADTTPCPVDLAVAATMLIWCEENARPELGLWQNTYDLLQGQLEGELTQPAPHSGNMAGLAIQRIR